MTGPGQTENVTPGTLILFRSQHFGRRRKHRGTFSHSLARPSDRVGQPVAIEPRREDRITAYARIKIRRRRFCHLDRADGAENLIILNQRLTQRKEVIIRQRLTDDLAERPQDRPVLARFAKGEIGAHRHLYATFGIGEDTGFLGVGRPRQDDIGTPRAGIAVMALIDHESLLEPRGVKLIRTEIIDDLDFTGFGRIDNAAKGFAAFAWHEAKIECCHPVAAV